MNLPRPFPPDPASAALARRPGKPWRAGWCELLAGRLAPPSLATPAPCWRPLQAEAKAAAKALALTQQLADAEANTDELRQAVATQLSALQARRAVGQFPFCDAHMTPLPPCYRSCNERGWKNEGCRGGNGGTCDEKWRWHLTPGFTSVPRLHLSFTSVPRLHPPSKNRSGGDTSPPPRKIEVAVAPHPRLHLSPQAPRLRGRRSLPYFAGMCSHCSLQAAHTCAHANPC
jgi:hypothetical protein